MVGLGASGDAFTVANTLPNVIYLVIAGGVLNSVLVPQLVKAAKNPDGGAEFTNRLLTITISAMLVISTPFKPHGWMSEKPVRSGQTFKAKP